MEISEEYSSSDLEGEPEIYTIPVPAEGGTNKEGGPVVATQDRKSSGGEYQSGLPPPSQTPQLSSIHQGEKTCVEEDGDPTGGAAVIPSNIASVSGIKTAENYLTFWSKYKWRITVLAMIFLFFVVVPSWSIALAILSSIEYHVVVYPGSLVQLVSSSFVWHDKCSISMKVATNEKYTRHTIYEDDVDANIYYSGSVCESKIKERSRNVSSKRYLHFMFPGQVEGLYGVYLLKDSRLIFNSSISPDSDSTYPIKLCRFNSKDAASALTEARDIKSITVAESKGTCIMIATVPKMINTTSYDEVHADGYYFYAISALSSSASKSVILYFQYTLFTYYFNENDFLLYNCDIDKGDSDCVFDGLTSVNGSHKFCVLAYIPVPPTQEITKYIFTARLSSPSSIYVLLISVTECLCVLSIVVIFICYNVVRKK